MKCFTELLQESNYDKTESIFLIKGFTEGFDIGYQGPQIRQSKSHNIPFSVGDKYVMWEKIMKEVEAGRYAGPYEKIPYENYIQSPIGLVPKAGNKTRLIFHLSYNFSEEDTGMSVNKGTPKDICRVRYNDLDDVIRKCILMSKKAEVINGHKVIHIGKTDLSSAFRVLPLRIGCFKWMVLKAEDPRDGKIKFFIDKCLLFGASISCSHYQHFLNSLRHILQFQTGKKMGEITNYLDDFLFIAILKVLCNQLISAFLRLCSYLNIPVAIEKTEWACTALTFLGILLNGELMVLSLPLEKQQKALKLLNDVIDRKKITVKQIQVLTGYLNFLTKAIPVGCTFTRRMYNKCTGYEVTQSGKKLKQHHHISVDSEFKFDCTVWKIFLENFTKAAVCRPMIDFDRNFCTATEIMFTSDASGNEKLGFGAVFQNNWLFGQWEPGYVEMYQPSIEYLELYALVTAMIT